MTPASYTLPAHLEGDIWEGLLIGPVTINGTAPAVALASARIHFRKAPTDLQPAYVLSTAPTAGQGSLTLLDAATWLVRAPRQPLPLKPWKKWRWEVEFVDANANVYSYVNGTLQVLPQLVK